MTYEQTREQFLLAWNSNAYLNMCESDDMHNAIVALEKQIPKKPYYGEVLSYKGFFGYLCPICRNWLFYADETPNSRDSFCSFCGQKIDWLEVEE